MVHIGEEIKKQVHLKKMQVTRLSKILNTNRNNIYDIYTRGGVDTQLLCKLSKALDYNFFHLYVNALRPLLSTHIEPATKHTPTEISEFIEIITKLRNEKQLLESSLRDKELIIELLQKEK
jgi:hypothetical protein